jgi:hypothetical protein
MNEYIDSTVGHIPVCLLCSLLVTIRGLVGPSMVVYCPEFRIWGMRSSDTRVQYLKTTALLGGRCGNLNWVSPELLLPVMSAYTPTDEGESSEEPVVVVSCCAGGKVPYQCCKKGIGYFIKNMRSESDPPVSRMPCPSTSISYTLSSRIQEPWSVYPHTSLRASEEKETPWKWLTIVSSSLESSSRSFDNTFVQYKKKNGPEESKKYLSFI